MSSSPKAKKKKLPRNINLKIAFLAPIEKEVKELFTEIFYDYLNRFNFPVPTKKVRVSVAGTEGAKEGNPSQLAVTMNTEDGDILVDIRDPSLDDIDTKHIYIHHLFIQTLCHEFVHVMQMITEKKEYALMPSVLNPDCKAESYFFSPDEFEAYSLAPFYESKFGPYLLGRCAG